MIALYLLYLFPLPNFKPGFMGTTEAKALGIKKLGNAPRRLMALRRSCLAGRVFAVGDGVFSDIEHEPVTGNVTLQIEGAFPTRHAGAFDHQVSYEALRFAFTGEDLALLDAAILQAATPYDPVPNPSSAAFFADYETFARANFPELVIKHNPNGNVVRPTESRTIYFDVPRTLRTWAALPRPRMSLQCRDSAAPSASVKIMLGGWGARAGSIPVPASMAEIGGYIRPAGRSLGVVIDTPQLDMQMPFDAQVPAAEEGLEAARRLVRWWNHHADTLKS